jgi:murein tripeptide amidase MpaA
MQKDFPDLVKINSIGKSFQGRDINYLEIDMPSEVKNKPAILLTGATHARELISTSFNVYQMLKLVMKGYV